VACILTECSRVHDAAPDDAGPSTPPGRVEVKVQRSKVLLTVLSQVPLGLPGGRFNFWLGRIFKV